MTTHDPIDRHRTYRHGRHGGPDDWRRSAERKLDWLRDRPGESWLFFAAGFVVAAIFF